MAGLVLTKRVYEPASAKDGARVLVMRLWPRGVRKDRVSVWLKDLGAERDLIAAFRRGGLPWPTFARRYRAGLAKPEARAALDELRALVRKGPVTLLCGCPDEARCHRGILKSLLSR